MCTAQWIWTCPEDKDDFIITSPCSARGLIKNMWLHSLYTLQIDWVLDSDVFPVLGDVCVCAQAGFILLSWIFLSLSGFRLHLSFIWSCSSGFGQTGLSWTYTPERLSLCVLRSMKPDEKHNRDNILFTMSLNNHTIQSFTWNLKFHFLWLKSWNAVHFGCFSK